MGIAEQIMELWGAIGELRRLISGSATEMPVARQRLTANLTLYVRTDGSDSNNGRANTAAGAFLTLQKAVDVAAFEYDHGTYQLTIQVGDGTYNLGAASLQLPSHVGRNPVIIKGNSGAPGNVVVSSSGWTIYGLTGAYWDVRDMKLVSSGTNCLIADRCKKIIVTNIEWSPNTNANAINATNASEVVVQTPQALSANAFCLLRATSLSYIYSSGVTWTFSNSPAISGATVAAEDTSRIDLVTNTFTNGATVTGKRYNAGIHGSIWTNGAGATYIPGNAAGTVSANYGVYA